MKIDLVVRKLFDVIFMNTAVSDDSGGIIQFGIVYIGWMSDLGGIQEHIRFF